MGKDRAKYKQAALAYVLTGVAIVVLTTLFIPEAHYRSGFIPLFAGLIILLVLAYFIFRGIRWLIFILTALAAARSAWWIYSFFVFADEASRWVYILNAVLNCFIVFMLGRAVVAKEEGADKVLPAK